MAVLALRAGSSVVTGEIVEALWGEEPPQSAQKTLHTYVWMLRRVLPSGVLATTSGGYRLDIDLDSVDVFVFERLAAVGHDALTARDARLAHGSLVNALALWRGPALSELADHPWGLGEVTRLVELRLACEEELADARLALGQHQGMIGDLEAAVAGEPLREHRWAQLMLALYRCGRQAEALRAYQRVRALLAEQLGIEPCSELRALEERMLLQSEDLEWHEIAPPSGMSATASEGPPSLQGSHSGETVGRETSGAADSEDQRHREPRAGSDWHAAERDLPTRGIFTFVYTDIVGSTLLWERFPSLMTEVLKRQDELVEACMSEEGGQVFKKVGDAVHAVFISPVAALRSALGAQAAVGAADWTEIGGLTIRIGVYTGEAELVDGEWRGRALNRCARLRDAADGREILASHATVELVGDDLIDVASITDLGESHLRGVPRGERTHKVEPVGSRPGFVTPPLVAPPLVARAAPEPGGSSQQHIVPASIARISRRTLIGRRAEIDRITGWMEDADRAIAVVLLAGEPGVGKTRLAAEVALSASGGDALVLFGRCDEGLGAPYQPFAEALGSYVDRQSSGVLKTLLDTNSSELTRLLPHLPERVAGLGPPTSAAPETERWLLFEAVVQFLRSLAVDRPVVLVLDDLQWAEPATLLLLRHLARAGLERVWMLATARASVHSEPEALVDVLGDLARDSLLERVDLTGLNEEEIKALVADRLDRSADEGFAEVLHAETGGNPFFVHEVVSHLCDLGLLGAGDWPGLSQVEQSGAPNGVRQVISRRVTQLSKPAGELLVVAAVAGSHFQPVEVARATGSDLDAVIGLLDEAATSGLIVESGVGGGAYRFAHALVRHTLYEGVSTLRRAMLHRRIADAIVMSTSPGNDRLSEIAYHYRLGLDAGDPITAVHWLQEAGDQACRQLAFDEAVDHYMAALRALEMSNRGDSAEFASLQLRLAAACFRAGRPELRKQAAEAAFRFAQQAGQVATMAEAALIHGGARSTYGVASDETMDLLNQAVAASTADASVDGGLLARVMARLAQETYHVQRFDEAKSLSARAVDIASRGSDPAALAATYDGRAWTLNTPDDVQERLALSAEMIRQASLAGEAEWEEMARIWSCSARPPIR